MDDTNFPTNIVKSLKSVLLNDEGSSTGVGGASEEEETSIVSKYMKVPLLGFGSSHSLKQKSYDSVKGNGSKVATSGESDVEEEEGEEQVVPDTPVPKYAFDYFETPKKLQDVHEDLLVYLFSYLTYQDLLLVSGTCKKFQQASSHDIIWRREYTKKKWILTGKPTVQRNFKNQFISCCKEVSSVGKRIETAVGGSQILHIIRGLNSALKYCCGYLSFIGLFLTFILVPIIMDGVNIKRTPSNFVYTFIPIGILMIPTMLFIFSCTLFDSTVIYAIARRLYRIVEQPVEFNCQSFLNSVHIFLGIIFAPTFISCLFIRNAMQDPVSYQMAFIPVYVVCSFFFMIGLISLCLAFIVVNISKNYKLDFTNNISAYPILCYANLLAIIQTLLFAAKMDGAIQTYWGVVFIPIWFNFLIICCCIPFCCGLGVITNSDMKLDSPQSLANIGFAVVFIPFYCMLCCCCGCCLRSFISNCTENRYIYVTPILSRYDLKLKFSRKFHTDEEEPLVQMTDSF